jgi:DNA-binding CsgD family transcriptional regulator
MIHPEDPEKTGKALLWEPEALIRERASQMLEEEGFAPCAVAHPALFQEVSRALSFDLFVVGIPALDRVPDVAWEELAGPVLILGPVEDPSLVAHLRVLLPGARLVDRALRNPDAVRRALGGAKERREESVAPTDTVRRAFEPFGLSERQLQVLQLALLGQSSREIGQRLYVSEPTVRNHLHAIYESVGVGGRRELLGRFVQGLLGETP